MTQPETIHIEDVNQFVALLTHWHGEKVKVLEHMMEVPEGTELETNGESIILQGDALYAFKEGISLALMELGFLPFVSESEAANIQ